MFKRYSRLETYIFDLEAKLKAKERLDDDEATNAVLTAMLQAEPADNPDQILELWETLLTITYKSRRKALPTMECIRKQSKFIAREYSDIRCQELVGSDTKSTLKAKEKPNEKPRGKPNNED